MLGIGLSVPGVAVRRRTASAVDYAARYGVVDAWLLREASGNRASAAGGSTLTDTNTVTGAAAIAAGLGVSSQFTAANTEQLTCVDAAALSITADADWWLSVWVQFDTLGADRGLVFKGTGTGATTLEYAVRYINATGRFRADWGDAGGVAATALTLSSSGAIATATPYHVLVAHAAAEDLLIGIVNGGTADTAATSGRIPTNTAGNFRLGVFNAAGNPHNGRLSDVTIGKPAALPSGVATMSALAAEIATRIYNGGTGRAYPFS
jgi:hypothetical protein